MRPSQISLSGDVFYANELNDNELIEVYRDDSLVIDGAYYYLRFAGNPRFNEGTEVNIEAMSFNYCNAQGQILADQSNPTTGGGSTGDDGSGGNTGGDGSQGSNNDDLPDADDTSNYPRDDSPLQ